jgi:Mo25-like
VFTLLQELMTRHKTLVAAFTYERYNMVRMLAACAAQHQLTDRCLLDAYVQASHCCFLETALGNRAALTTSCAERGSSSQRQSVASPRPATRPCCNRTTTSPGASRSRCGASRSFGAGTARVSETAACRTCGPHSPPCAITPARQPRRSLSASNRSRRHTVSVLTDHSCHTLLNGVPASRAVQAEVICDPIFCPPPQLLGEILLDPANAKTMMRYVTDAENLKLMMVLLKETSKSIQFEAFHVFKVR